MINKNIVIRLICCPYKNLDNNSLTKIAHVMVSVRRASLRLPGSIERGRLRPVPFSNFLYLIVNRLRISLIFLGIGGSVPIQ